MTQQLINIGNKANDGKGDQGRVAFDKVNDNFTELYPIKAQVTELYAIKAQVQYTKIVTASKTILDSDLVIGHNIYGVNYPGAVLISLPADIDSRKIVVINDESGNAGTNNITLIVV